MILFVCERDVKVRTKSSHSTIPTEKTTSQKSTTSSSTTHMSLIQHLTMIHPY